MIKTTCREPLETDANGYKNALLVNDALAIDWLKHGLKLSSYRPIYDLKEKVMESLARNSSSMKDEEESSIDFFRGLWVLKNRSFFQCIDLGGLYPVTPCSFCFTVVKSSYWTW